AGRTVRAIRPAYPHATTWTSSDRPLTTPSRGCAGYLSIWQGPVKTAPARPHALVGNCALVCSTLRDGLEIQHRQVHVDARALRDQNVAIRRDGDVARGERHFRDHPLHAMPREKPQRRGSIDSAGAAY